MMVIMESTVPTTVQHVSVEQTVNVNLLMGNVNLDVLQGGLETSVKHVSLMHVLSESY